MKAILVFACISLLAGFLILLHQYIFFGVWFSLSDIHHETFAVAFVCLGLGVLIGLVGGTREA